MAAFNRNLPPEIAFEEARDLVIWHYQWIVLHDFLSRILDKSVL